LIFIEYKLLSSGFARGFLMQKETQFEEKI
jgi:hypothetical protein